MFSNLKIAARFALASIVLCALAIAVAAIGYRQIASLRSQIDEFPELLDVRLALSEWQGETITNAARTLAILRSADTSLGEQLAPEMKATSARISELQKRIESLPLDDAARRQFAALGKLRAAYIAAREATLKLRQARDASAEQSFQFEFVPALTAYQNSIREFVDGHAAAATREQAAAKQGAARGVLALGAGTALFMLLAAVLVWRMVRSVTVPVREVVGAAEALASGDLRQTLAVRSQDEMGQLGNAMNRTLRQLGSMVGRIKETSDQVSAAAQEIAQGTTDLSSRTEEQASSLEETAASLEQMTVTVTQNAENAKKASQLAAGAAEVAARGGAAVGAVAGTMAQITASSRRIAEITGVIDGIAFQTNILALNAAVEAARAGTQGRGFAVVASEVRNLAQRAGTAAKEIRQLITVSASTVDAGSRQVVSAGQTMEEIVAAVGRVNGLVAEITLASQEQAQGIEQVSGALQQLEKVTQQNAAMVEEATAASAALEEQAQSMSRAVGGFRLAADAPGTVPGSAEELDVAREQVAGAAPREDQRGLVRVGLDLSPEA